MEKLSGRWRHGGPGKRSPSRRLTYLAAFYVGIPVALALYSGASESGSAAFIEKRYYFFYFLAASLPVWLAFDVCTRFAQWVLRPWQPRLLVILVLGAILGLHLQGLWTPWRQSLFEPYLAEGSRFYSVFPWRYSEPDYLVKAVIAWVAASVIWAGANIFFLQVFGLPRYGYRASGQTGAGLADDAGEERGGVPSQPTSSPSATRMAILLDKLPDSLGTDIVALKAEEHYTRVYTTRGEALILMRFSDAVDLLEELGGLQTHRSYWANPQHIEEMTSEGRSSRLHLSKGIDIPVSRTYRALVRQALSAANHRSASSC